MWMVIAGLLLWVFMIGGMKRQLVPGRWQVAVEGFTGFISSMMNANIGPEGRKYTPYVFSLFMFILMLNVIGLMPFGLFGLHPFTVTSHFAIKIGRASCRARVCPYVYISVVAVSLKNKNTRTQYIQQ